MKNKRRNFSAEFKAKVAIEAIKELQTLSAIAVKYDLHPNQITDWKKQFLASASIVFSLEGAKKEENKEDSSKLYEQIAGPPMRSFTSGKYFSKKKLMTKPVSIRKQMISKEYKGLSIIGPPMRSSMRFIIGVSFKFVLQASQPRNRVQSTIDG